MMQAMIVDNAFLIEVRIIDDHIQQEKRDAGS
jgi:hypothetical protein